MTQLAQEIQTIQGALAIFIIAVLGSLALIVRFAPGWIDKQVKLKQQEMADQLEAEKSLRLQAEENAKQERIQQEEDRKQFNRMIDENIEASKSARVAQQANINAQNTQVKVLTNLLEYVVKLMEKQDETNKRLQAADRTAVEGVQVAGEIKDSVDGLKGDFDTLLDTGSKPLRGLIEKVDNLDKKVALAATKEQLEKVLAEVSQINTHVQVLRSIANARLEEVKQATGEVPAVNLTVNTSPSPA